METEDKQLKNPFIGYVDFISTSGEKINPVHEIVNLYYKLKGLDKMHKKFYKGRYGYGKLAREAKNLLKSCKESLEDAMWCLDKMKYKADKGGFDWSISTCLKHNLIK